ncbi:leucyl aminopeptidase [Parvularcula dongshanensis]|uniref:Probable cytosol aminopeptidase n=1 Tax=Parvularcula dongshanensis TaxID=1173995 RepID=A0A840I749_9PROT|nr:leucyl aminopeptidase [Parvularcula dongshanensis]MBB4660073.1 leucyl aminopeptidase [Parvularcula dongshanensis]
MDVVFAPDLPTTGLLAVPVAEDGLGSDAFKTIDARSSGALSRAARASDFNGKKGQTLSVAGPEGLDEAVVLLVGVGKADSFGPADANAFGGKAAAAAQARHASCALVLSDVALGALTPAQLAAQAALGAEMRAYSFTKYKKSAEPDDLPKLRKIVAVTDAADAEAAYADDAAVAAGVRTARDLVSEPPNMLYPASFAERCRELESVGIEVEILDEAQMMKLGMGSLLGVGQGSTRESFLAVMRWNGGAKDERPIAFVGKGVTFDTGGISLKPGAGMEAMKMDMGGAAAVTGALHALAARKAPANVVGLIGLVENMPDGNAQRPSDIVTSMSGQTIEVLNTDAEGRLVLADVLHYAQDRYKPSAIVDLATLTGAIIISLADQYGGMFTEDDDLAAALMAAGEASGERLWRMPLGDAHRDMIKSDVADMKNIGGRDGGSSSAAAFLSKFVQKGTPWAHLDIAGMAWSAKDKDLCPKGATGFGVRLLDAFVRARAE